MESRNQEINSVAFPLNSEEAVLEMQKVQSEIINSEAAEDEKSAVFSPEEKKKSFLERIKNSEFFTKGFCITFWIFFISAIIYVISRLVPEFAEFWTRYPAQGIRFVLAKLTGWLPFSLAECIITAIPVIAIGYIIASGVSTRRDETNRNFYKWIRPVISIVLVILTIFFAGFGPAYGRYKLTENLGLEQKAVSADELYETAVIVSSLAEKDLGDIGFDVTGTSVMPYDYNTLVDKVNEAFDKYSESVDYISHFSSNPKPIALSEPMTYTHISGVYTFMTGESNINTNYPDFLMPFTMAHEMAHQRGIAREDEANFVAFLVCIGSDDAYLRYSAYANMENYLLSALADADVKKYSEIYINYIPYEIKLELISYSSFFDKYRDSVASEVTGTVNNTFLQSQGQQAGTKSYGLVVDLAVAYYKQ